MTQPPAVVAAPTGTIDAFRRVHERLTDEYAAILTNPNGEARRRRIRAIVANIDRELATLAETGGRFIADRLPEVYALGGQGAAATIGGPRFEWNQFHRRSIAAVAEDAFDDVLARTQYMSDDAKRWARDVSRRLTQDGYIEGQTAQDLRRKFAREGAARLDAQGIPHPITAVQYADGSFRTADDWADMFFRTKTAEVYNLGTINQSRQVGVTRFEILDGANCGLRSHNDVVAADGTIVSAETALEFPVSHPRCRRTFAPRPDLDPTTTAEPDFSRDIGADDTRRSTAQRQAQADAEAARDRAVARRAARRRRQGRTGRNQAARDRSRRAAAVAEADAAAAAALEEAKAEARRLARRRSALRASADAARTKIRRNSADVLDRFDITPDQLRQARAELAELRSELRATAQNLAAEAADANPFPNIVKLPRRKAGKFVETDANGFTVPVGREWDWLEVLDEETLRRYRRRATLNRGQGATPDQFAQGFADIADENFEQALERWRLIVDTEDTARSIATGRRSGQYVDVDDLYAETDIAIQMNDRGLQVSDLLADVPDDEIAGLLAQADQDLVLRYADEIFEVRTNRPRPWEMTPDEFAEELTAYVENPDIQAIVARAEEFGDAALTTDQERLVFGRFREMVPEGLDLDAEDVVGVHERLVHLRRLADEADRYFDDAPAPTVNLDDLDDF